MAKRFFVTDEGSDDSERNEREKEDGFDTEGRMLLLCAALGANVGFGAQFPATFLAFNGRHFQSPVMVG